MLDPKTFCNQYCSVKDGIPPVKVTYSVERDIWELVERYCIQVQDVHYTIPEGYTFDLASIPRGVWTLIAPFELSLVAPLLHDFQYEHKGELPIGSMMPPHKMGRKEVDKIFYEIMKMEGVSWWRRQLAYRAVRWFGGSYWKN